MLSQQVIVTMGNCCLGLLVKVIGVWPHTSLSDCLPSQPRPLGIGCQPVTPACTVCFNTVGMAWEATCRPNGWLAHVLPPHPLFFKFLAVKAGAAHTHGMPACLSCPATMPFHSWAQPFSWGLGSVMGFFHAIGHANAQCPAPFQLKSQW